MIRRLIVLMSAALAVLLSHAHCAHAVDFKIVIESARIAARAWTAAYGDCPIDDKTGLK